MLEQALSGLHLMVAVKFASEETSVSICLKSYSLTPYSTMEESSLE